MVRHLKPVFVDRGAAAKAARVHGARAAFPAAEVPLAVAAAGSAWGDVLHVVRRAALDAEARRRGADLQVAPRPTDHLRLRLGKHVLQFHRDETA